tara:strand:+ start:167 stop:1234 length:1068 start_codon:yes stop_codon:yes gene_type:complete
MLNQNKLTQISEIGEFGLIEKLKTKIKTHNSLIVRGIGDDSAVIKSQKDQEILISTDLLIEGIHFDTTYMSLSHVGYKSVIVNLSDIFAMNATPSQITVSLGISSKYNVEDIENLYEGINKAAKNYNINIIGGDISGSYTGLTISITVIGFQKKNKIVYRDGAKSGDLIVLSGDVGSSFLGLKILQREKMVLSEHKTPKFAINDIELKLKEYTYLIQRQIKPEAKKEIVNYFKQHNITPTSMIDISDGLSSDLNHISKASSLGYKIMESKIPIHRQTKNASLDLNIDYLFAALYGGEDYELLFTTSPKNKDLIDKTEGLSIIGELTKDVKNKTITKSNGEILSLDKKGWDHFKSA